MFYQYEGLLDEAREQVAALINAPVEECVFVLNATTGLFVEFLLLSKHTYVSY